MLQGAILDLLRAGLGKLADSEGEALTQAAKILATTLFAKHHPITTLLCELQALDVVRLIQGKK